MVQVIIFLLCGLVSEFAHDELLCSEYRYDNGGGRGRQGCCIQGNICPSFIFAPFTLVVSWQVEDWANYNVSNHLSLIKTLTGQIQERAKPTAIEGRK